MLYIVDCKNGFILARWDAWYISADSEARAFIIENNYEVISDEITFMGDRVIKVFDKGMSREDAIKAAWEMLSEAKKAGLEGHSLDKAVNEIERFAREWNWNNDGNEFELCVYDDKNGEIEVVYVEDDYVRFIEEE